jgi:hypothetical protein
MPLVRIQWKPKPKTLRSFGFFAFVFFGIIGNWIAGRAQLFGISISPAMGNGVGLAFGILAAACLILAMAHPRALHPLFVGLSVITAPIGFVISTAVMLLVWFGMITPIGFFMRLFGWDPMKRDWKQSESCWEKRDGERPAQSYLNPY